MQPSASEPAARCPESRDRADRRRRPPLGPREVGPQLQHAEENEGDDRGSPDPEGPARSVRGRGLEQFFPDADGQGQPAADEDEPAESEEGEAFQVVREMPPCSGPEGVARGLAEPSDGLDDASRQKNLKQETERERPLHGPAHSSNGRLFFVAEIQEVGRCEQGMVANEMVSRERFGERVVHRRSERSGGEASQEDGAERHQEDEAPAAESGESGRERPHENIHTSSV